MNEAQQMHDELVNALLPIIPRTTYQDLRRLSTLAWAITSLCLTRDPYAWVPWPRYSRAAPSLRLAVSAASPSFLHHPAIDPPQWYAPILRRALSDWSRNARVYVALDTTALTPFVLIRASLIYRGRAIPLAWRAMRHKSTKVGFQDYQPVLEQVRSIVPPGLVITMLADRGFVHEQLLHYLRTQQWHFRLRLMGNTLMHLSAQPVSAVRDLCPPGFREALLP